MNALDSKEAMPLDGLCTRCIGRIFASEGHGLTNHQRGESFIESQSQNGIEISVVKETECRICQGIFQSAETYATEISRRLSSYEYAGFTIGCTFSEETIEMESSIQASFGSKGESIKKEFNREIGKLIEQHTGKSFQKDDPDIMIKVDTRYMSMDFQVKSLFVYGTYRKYSRDMPQTRWIKYTEKKDTIESIIGEILNSLTGGDAYFLHGAGREDVDVRMLGNGREFIIESCNPKQRSIDLDKLGKLVNSSGKNVEIQDLSFTTRDKVRILKEEKHSKVYLATVVADKDIDKEAFLKSLEAINGKVIYQRTPLRVSTSRSDLVRERMVFGITMENLQGNTATLRIEAEAGVYIKELVSGDRGRTNPNLSDVSGMDLTISELDVIEIKR